MPTENFFSKKQPWSKIKDKIIACYLKPYCAKVLSLNKPLKIVDCFAGKGKFDDGGKGSPLIISELINEISQYEDSYKNKNIGACFIEKKYYNELKANTQSCNKCKVLEGTFEDNFQQVVDNGKDINLFLYIDPYGIKSLSFDIFQEINKKEFLTTEFIMNFNSFGFLREGFRLLKFTKPDELNEVTFEEDEKNSIEKMNLIANGDYWQEIIKDKNEGKINMHQAEDIFVNKYIEEIKKIYQYVVNIPIKEKMENIPKYHLIFGTNHPEGVRLMVDNMNNAWEDIRKTNIYDTFDIFAQPNYYTLNQYNLEEEILKIVESRIHIKDIILELINLFGIAYKYSDYTNKLNELSKIQDSLFEENKRKLKVIREYKTPTGKEPSDWNWDNEIYLEKLDEQ